MQKTLAWVALTLAGSLVGCAKDKDREPSAAKTEPRGPSTPVEVAKSAAPVQPAAREEPKMTPASGTTERKPASGTEERTPASATREMAPASGTGGLTPASGTRVPGAGAEPGPELAVTSRGSVLLQQEAASELAAAVCQRQSACGENASRDCQRTVLEQSKTALAGCDHGLSRTEFYVCLTAISEKACGTSASTLAECSAASLCLP